MKHTQFFYEMPAVTNITIFGDTCLLMSIPSETSVLSRYSIFFIKSIEVIYTNIHPKAFVLLCHTFLMFFSKANHHLNKTWFLCISIITIFLLNKIFNFISCFVIFFRLSVVLLVDINVRHLTLLLSWIYPLILLKTIQKDPTPFDVLYPIK